MSTTRLSCLLIGLLLGTAPLLAQRDLKRADKEYELYAFNLAVKSYLEALEKDPTNVAALGKLADSYRHINRLEEAAKYYQRAIDTKGRIDPEFYYQYGQTLKGLQRYDEAARWFRKYAETNPVFGAHYAETVDFAKANLGTAAQYEVVATSANGTASDYGPTIYEDALVFVSSRDADAKARVNNRLYRAPIGSTGALGNAERLDTRLGGQSNVGPVSYSPDGRRVAVTHNNFVDGTRQLRSAGMALSLSLAEVQEDGSWGNETPFPHNGLNFNTGYATFGPDGKALYFASDRPDGFGGYDIYVSYPVGSSWSAPENLGAVINTQGDEITPFYDGNHLYFASDWHPGFGGYDQFRAERTGERWTEVFNMGNGINSARDDYGFVYDNLQNRGFLTSNRNGGKGKEDIYRTRGSGATPNSVTLTVLEANTRRPVDGAEVDFTTCGLPTYRTDARGNYLFRTMDGMNCRPIVRKDGYVSSSFEIATAGTGMPAKVEVLLSPRGGVAATGTTSTPTIPTPATSTSGTIAAPVPVGEVTGRVVATTDGNRGLADVAVEATNQLTGQKLSAVTSASGDYTLALEPNNSYVVRYSKAGYVDLRRTVNVANDGRNPLSTISLLPTGNAVTDTAPLQSTTVVPGSTVRPVPSTTTPAPAAPTTTTPEAPYSGRNRAGGYVGGEVNPNTGRPYTEGDGYPQPTTSTPQPTTADPIVTTPVRPAPVPVTPAPTPTYTPPSQPTTTTTTRTTTTLSGPSGTYRSGYAVQIGAFRNDANLLARYQNLSGIGSVYYVKSGDLAKVRVGTYGSRASAAEAQESLRRRGYAKAFVVNEDGGTLTYDDGGGNAPVSYDSPSTTTTTTYSGGLYYVRLGAFASKKFFAADRFEDLGSISERPNGATTILLLGAYGSADDARYALQQVQQRGLPDAYIAQDAGGTLRKVR